MNKTALTFDFVKNLEAGSNEEFRITRTNQPEARAVVLELLAKLVENDMPLEIPIQFSNGASIGVYYIKRGRRVEYTW